MKILTWNCNGALRKKLDILRIINADINVIQECENPEEAKNEEYKKWASNHLWIGDSKNKGIGIFASQDIKLKKLNWSDNYQNHRVKYFLPCSINEEFNLLAVWTHRNNSPTFGYIGQLWKYLQINKDNLGRAIVIGDFNSNSIWDTWDRWWNHSDVVKELADLGIDSLYHKFYGEEQGKESKPTFFLHRKPEKPYHIDYVFGCDEIKKGVKKVTVGKIEDWLKISDHLPIICEIEIKKE